MKKKDFCIDLTHITGQDGLFWISPEATKILRKLLKKKGWHYYKKDGSQYYLDGEPFHNDIAKHFSGVISEVKISNECLTFDNLI